MNILIIGGAGFLGYSLSKYLSKNSFKVDIIDNFSRKTSTKDIEILNENNNINLIEGNLIDLYKDKTISNDYNIIFHFAAIVGVYNVVNQPYETLSKNILLTDLAIKVALMQNKLDKFIFTSTSEVYSGAIEKELAVIPTPENTQLIIEDSYSKRATYKLSKITGEALCLNSGLPVTILRPHNIYGPRMGMSHVIPELIKKILFLKDGESLDVFSANHTRTFCYIDDAINLFYLIMQNKNTDNEILNMGAPNPEIKIIELAKILCALSKKNIKINVREIQEGSISRRCPDMNKTIKLTNYKPIFDLKTGLTNTFNWYEQNINVYS